MQVGARYNVWEAAPCLVEHSLRLGSNAARTHHQLGCAYDATMPPSCGVGQDRGGACVPARQLHSEARCFFSQAAARWDAAGGKSLKSAQSGSKCSPTQVVLPVKRECPCVGHLEGQLLASFLDEHRSMCLARLEGAARALLVECPHLQAVDGGWVACGTHACGATRAVVRGSCVKGGRGGRLGGPQVHMWTPDAPQHATASSLLPNLALAGFGQRAAHCLGLVLDQQLQLFFGVHASVVVCAALYLLVGGWGCRHAGCPCCLGRLAVHAALHVCIEQYAQGLTGLPFSPSSPSTMVRSSCVASRCPLESWWGC